MEKSGQQYLNEFNDIVDRLCEMNLISDDVNLTKQLKGKNLKMFFSQF